MKTEAEKSWELKPARGNSMTHNPELQFLTSLLVRFLNQFDWTPSVTAQDLAEQEKRGDQRLIGVCYDACKYLAQKLHEAGIPFKSWWVCGLGEKSLEKWKDCAGLHSFNLCRIPVTIGKNTVMQYYFADCAFAPYCLAVKESKVFLKGFSSETQALETAVKLIAGNEPYLLRQFDPLTVKMGNHVFYTAARMLNVNL